MAQFTTFIAHGDHLDEFLTCFPQSTSYPVAHDETEALELASEKFLEQLSHDDESSEWITEVDHLTAFEIFSTHDSTLLIGWDIDSL